MNIVRTVLTVLLPLAALNLGCIGGQGDSESDGTGGSSGSTGTGTNTPKLCDNDNDGEFAPCDESQGADGYDCNDLNANVGHAKVEICGNAVDEDCDGVLNNGCGGGNPCVDGDSDGFCASGTGSPPYDCVDNDANVHPGASEICDGKDNNCNGAIDDGLNCGGGNGGAPVQICIHVKWGDLSQIWIKGYLSNAGDSDGYKESLMTLAGASGPNEEWRSEFDLPAASVFNFWPETFVNNSPAFVFDVCDYPAAPNCSGKGAFCVDRKTFAWVTKGDCSVNGTPVDYVFKDNVDNLGVCSANGEFVVPQP